MPSPEDSTIESLSSATSLPAAPLPERIGRYRILGQIGEGGFGDVFEAEQTEPVRRRVALKVIKLGMDTKQVMARFEAERQALAMMDHPNIARVIDAGATDAGRPYFVMELVKGEPITEYCDKNTLPVEARLRLLQQVCKAVQHAHQKGIIHRDIKPSNVLITLQDGRPVPKVIDFGIAKATSARLTEKTVFTEQRQLIGTPEYMSPEQAEMSGIDIDTRSDVYSLGVLLYELLTGVTPFDSQTLRSAAFGEIQRIIREHTPPKPSTRLSTLGTAERVARARHTEPRRLGVLIRGDLDWIVMKALEKDRTRRYETANGFAADIERYLKSEPTLASPPSAAYRLRKFIRRNKGGVVAASLVATALVVGMLGTTWGMTRAIAEQERADTEMLRAIEAAKAEAAARQEAEQLADFQASMLRQVDATTAGVRLTSDVNERFREALSEAGVGETEIAERSDAFRAAWRRVNATDAALALIDETILTPAVAAIDRQFADQALVDARLRQVMAVRYRDLGLLDAALPLQERVLEIRRRELGVEHADTLLSVCEQVELLTDMGRYEDAAPLAHEAMETARRTLGPDDPGTLKAMSNMGTLLWNQGEFAEAEPYFREVVERRRRTQGDDHPDTLTSIGNLGLLLQDQGRYDEAEECFREALAGDRRVRGDDHPSTLISINNMGLLLQRQGRLEEAEPYYRESLDGQRRALGDDHPGTQIAINNMGMLLQAQGRFAEAEVLLRQAMEARRRTAGDDNPQTLNSISNFGFVLQAQGRLDEAEPYLREAMEARRRILGDDNPNTLISISNMARLDRERGRLDLAERGLREAVQTGQRTLGEDHPYTLIFAGYLGGVLVEQGKHEEAIALLTPIETATRERLTGSNIYRLATLLTALGSARVGLGYDAERFALAETNLLEAHSIFVESRGEEDEETKGCTKALADLYRAWDTAKPGAGYAARASEWQARVDAAAAGE